MGMIKEFRSFAIKGNVVDLAVGVIIGAAFGKIVESLVNDIIMPVFAALFGGRLDFTNLFVALGPVPAGVAPTYEALKKAGVPLFAWGSFLTILLNFLLLAFVIFLLVKQVNRWKSHLDPVEAAAAQAAAEADPPPSEQYLKEIRDLLAERDRRIA